MAVSTGNKDSGMVDRKLDHLMGELERYRVSVAGIQETKWFGSDVGWVYFIAPLPSDYNRSYKNEGRG